MPIAQISPCLKSFHKCRHAAAIQPDTLVLADGEAKAARRNLFVRIVQCEERHVEDHTSRCFVGMQSIS